MARKYRGELAVIAGIGLAALAFIFWMIPTQIPMVRALGGSDGTPRFVPYLVGGGVLAVLLGRLIRMLVRPEAEPDPIWEGSYFSNATIIIAATLVYAFFGLGFLGFYISSALLGIGVMLILGERRAGIILLVLAVVLLGIYGLFERALGVYMPAGSLIDVSRLITGIFQ